MNYFNSDCFLEEQAYLILFLSLLSIYQLFFAMSFQMALNTSKLSPNFSIIVSKMISRIVQESSNSPSFAILSFSSSSIKSNFSVPFPFKISFLCLILLTNSVSNLKYSTQNYAEFGLFLIAQSIRFRLENMFPFKSNSE